MLHFIANQTKHKYTSTSSLEVYTYEVEEMLKAQRCVLSKRELRAAAERVGPQIRCFYSIYGNADKREYDVMQLTCCVGGPPSCAHVHRLGDRAGPPDPPPMGG